MGSFCVSTYFPFRAPSPSRVMETQCLSAEGSQSLWGLETYSGPRHRALGTSLNPEAPVCAGIQARGLHARRQRLGRWAPRDS